MKSVYYSIFLFMLCFLTSCQNDKKIPAANSFLATADTLIISTEKQKGGGLFSLGVTPIAFKNLTESFSNDIILSTEIEDIKHSYFDTDLKQKDNFYVIIIKGTKNGEPVFIVDENNNKNLTDDKVRAFKKIAWFSSENLIPCSYSKRVGNEIVIDSSWLKIGTIYGDLQYGRSDHVSGTFTIDNNSFEISIAAPRNMSFSYNIDPQLVLKNDRGNIKDTITHRDKIMLGEFVKLDETYYKFQSITDDGTTVTLVKENNFTSKKGTQAGMIAPEFEVVTTKKDTIRSADLPNTTTLLVNSCGCSGLEDSVTVFEEIAETYKDLNVFRIDSNIKQTSDVWQIDMENEANKTFYKIYRKEYCSVICYVIGKNNRILDKFESMDWQSTLPEILAREDASTP
ncbi:hypothetical protein [Kordia sp.]|uniref:hypothetical protein n=1 Tax=Kordia sp. TaxID=1965332 RepID=UPI003D2A8B59